MGESSGTKPKLLGPMHSKHGTRGSVNDPEENYFFIFCWTAG